jgi:hypothetical protein
MASNIAPRNAIRPPGEIWWPLELLLKILLEVFGRPLKQESSVDNTIVRVHSVFPLSQE